MILQLFHFMVSFFKNRRRQKAKKKAQTTAMQLESMVKRTQLTQLTLDQIAAGVGNQAEHEIVVSLTTFDKRIEDAYIAIESLMQQSLKADRIVLCLSEQDFSMANIPATLKKQMARGLELLFCEEDLGPYTKYFYTLKKYPHSLILTVDDDFIYPPYLIDQLYRAYLNNPEVIHCHRSHKMTFSVDGKLNPYKQWGWDHVDSTPSLHIFPTGVGGVLYFPGCFDADVTNRDKLIKLCRSADDVWLKAMSLKKGILCAQVKEYRAWSPRFLSIEGTQTFSLKRRNKNADSGNDIKLQAVFDHYQLWDAIKDNK
jgi:hypothetical protein|tara:strand:+ start:32 stop:970 length:939 start_codon:yes stop_codon:yes gene_type:complete